MPTNKKLIDQIIADCVAADPTLKVRADELRGIVTELLASKPDTRFDEAFAARLRDTLLARQASHESKRNHHSLSFFDRMQNKPLLYALSGGALVSLALIITLVQPKLQNGMPASMQDNGSQIASADGVTLVAPNAFGALTGTAATAVMAPMADGAEGHAESSMPTSRPQSGGGGPASAMLGTDAAMSSKMMVPPDYVPTVYTYVYKGEIVLPTDAQVSVYRHVKGLAGNTSASQFSKLLAGLMDGTKFGSGALQNVSMLEDREYGYNVNVDAVEGAINLSQNWMRWPHPENLCRDEACYQQYRIQPNQIPSDADILAIAASFMDEYGVDTSRFGTPEVRNEFRVQIAAATDLSQVYLPESVQVVYPLALDGQTAYDESGLGYGVSLNVNIRYKKVDGMWGLTTNRFEKSAYEAVTDTAAVQKFLAAQSGNWGDTTGMKIVDLELGAPEVVLSRFWSNDANGVGQELYVPMLRFTIQNPPANEPWFRKFILVPLAKDLLEQANGNGGYPMPYMLMKADAGSAPNAGVPETAPAVMP